jgi:hypothetical protein
VAAVILVICAYSDAQATAYLLKHNLREGTDVLIARTPADIRKIRGQRYKVLMLNGFFRRRNAGDVDEALRQLAGATTRRRAA